MYCQIWPRQIVAENSKRELEYRHEIIRAPHRSRLGRLSDLRKSRITSHRGILH